MTPGDRNHRRAVLRITDLIVTQDHLEGQIFEECRILGPAVLAPGDGCVFSGCVWEGSIDAVLWEVPQGQDRVIGVVGLINCEFYNTRFEGIGMAMKRPGADDFRTALAEGNL